uniref:Putative coat protein n=1 Tax=Beauveria bassiana chrysovirus 2 TaxID=2810134 RepID=A0A7U1GIV6_9VIRU|nr:putative coat protein [Beauveria bassiana chrysovirus 2]
MAAAQHQSVLSIHEGLGLPDSLRRHDVLPSELMSAIAEGATGGESADGHRSGAASGVAGSVSLDQSNAARKPVALQSMAGKELYGTFLMLGDSDFDSSAPSEGAATHSITLAYALEPPGSRLLRSSTTEMVAPYPAMIEHRHACRVSYRAKRNYFSKSSASAAMDGLAHHAASGNNAPVTLGVSREMLHARSIRYGGEMDSVFLRMWMAHLSVLAKRSVTVRVDRPALRGALSGVPEARESDRARVLSGVRVNGRGLTSHALALLVVGCGTLSGLAGMHQRADRYRFRSTPLTLYGTTDNAVSNVELVDAHKTGAAIVALASRFAAQSACARALRAALLLFGVSDSGRSLTLNCAEPDLHDDSVVNLGVAGGVMCSNSDLGDARLLSLSLFAGRAWRQVAGHMLRAHMLQINATDVDAAGAAILPMQRTSLREVGAQHGELFSDLSSLVDSEEYILNNHGSLWSERGIAHSLAYGVVVSGSVAEEATRAVDVPFASSLTSTDDPAVRKDMARSVATLLLVQSLVTCAGEDLLGSEVARVRRATTVTQFTNQVTQLGGGQVQFTLLGVGSGLSVQLSDRAAEWTPQAEGKTTLDSEPQRPHHLAESLANERREPNVERVRIDELMTTQLPRGSLMRRVRGLEASNAYTGDTHEGPIVVLAGQENDSVKRLESEGYNVVPTSGAGLLCGARAVATSLAAQHGKEVLLDEVMAAIKESVGEDARNIAASAGVRLEDSNFTADQLAAGVSRLGDYSLVAITEDGSGVRAFRVPGGSVDSPTVVVHNRGGHWSGVARTAGTPIRLDRRTRW